MVTAPTLPQSYWLMKLNSRRYGSQVCDVGFDAVLSVQAGAAATAAPPLLLAMAVPALKSSELHASAASS